MNPLSRVLLLIAATVLLLRSFGQTSPPAESDVPKGEVLKFSFEQSKIFPGTFRDYWAYVPAQYTPDKPAIRLSTDANGRAIGGSTSGAICDFTAAWQRPDAFSRVFDPICIYVGLRGGDCTGKDIVVIGEECDSLFATCFERLYGRKVKAQGVHAWAAPVKPSVSGL